MRNITKLKIGLQIGCMAVTAVAIFNLPLLSSRPPERWTILLVVACFSFGLFWGLGVSHFFPSEPEQMSHQ